MTTIVKDILAIDGGHKRNCTVLTLALTAQIPHEDAFLIAKEAGRADHKGMSSACLIKSFNKKHAARIGGRFKKVKRSTITVQKFCKLFPEGKYYIRKRGHAYAIIDGVAHNGTKVRPLERILEAWKFCVDSE